MRLCHFPTCYDPAEDGRDYCPDHPILCHESECDAVVAYPHIRCLVHHAVWAERWTRLKLAQGRLTDVMFGERGEPLSPDDTARG